MPAVSSGEPSITRLGGPEVADAEESWDAVGGDGSVGGAASLVVPRPSCCPVAGRSSAPKLGSCPSGICREGGGAPSAIGAPGGGFGPMGVGGADGSHPTMSAMPHTSPRRVTQRLVLCTTMKFGSLLTILIRVFPGIRLTARSVKDFLNSTHEPTSMFPGVWESRGQSFTSVQTLDASFPSYPSPLGPLAQPGALVGHRGLLSRREARTSWLRPLRFVQRQPRGRR